MKWDNHVKILVHYLSHRKDSKGLLLLLPLAIRIALRKVKIIAKKAINILNIDCVYNS